MPTYRITQYEIWTSDFEVGANSRVEAIWAVQRGQGRSVDNSGEVCEVYDGYGMTREEDPEFFDECQSAGVLIDDERIASIKSVEELDD